MEQVGRDMRLAEQELGRLTVILQNDTNSLKHADEAFPGRKGQILQLEQWLPEAWGNQAMQEGPNSATLIALRTYVEDFPRCRKHLVAKVEAAKRALKEFEKNST